MPGTADAGVVAAAAAGGIDPERTEIGRNLFEH
jgi:hypothetical protein